MAKNSEGDREVRMGIPNTGTLYLRCPSYKPFLLGIVKQIVETKMAYTEPGVRLDLIALMKQISPCS